MAAHGVQHHQRVLAAFLVQDLIESRQQDVIQTFTVTTEFRQVQRGEVHSRCHVLAHTLAARVVVEPGDVHAGTLQDVQQVVLARCPGVVVPHAVHVGEHAGHGMGRRCAAAAHVVEVDDLVAPLGQPGRGLPCIAVQPPVLGTGGLTHDQHDEMAVIVGLGLRHGQIQLHVRHACPVPGFQFGSAGHDEVGRHDQVRHVPVVAEERGVILVEVPGHSADHQYRKDNQNSTLRNLLVPATVVHLHHEVQQRRHDTQTRDPPQVRRRHQATAFRPAGDQHIGEHVLVEVDVEEQRLIGNRGPDHQQQRDDHLVQQGRSQQLEDAIEQEEEQHRQRVHEPVCPPIELDDLLVEGNVECDGEVEGHHRDQRRGRSMKAIESHNFIILHSERRNSITKHLGNP